MTPRKHRESKHYQQNDRIKPTVNDKEKEAAAGSHPHALHSVKASPHKNRCGHRDDESVKKQLRTREIKMKPVQSHVRRRNVKTIEVTVVPSGKK